MRSTDSRDQDALRISDIRPVAAGRRLWANRRNAMERSGLRYTTIGVRKHRSRVLYHGAKAVLTLLLKGTGLYWVGYRHARRVSLREVELRFPHLPPAFDGFRILHLSDLHIDAFPGIAEAIMQAVSGLAPDICVMTGDFFSDEDAPHDETLPVIGRLAESIEARHGAFAVLGNHDSCAFGQALEQRLGIRLLANEAVSLRRGTDRISLAGLDDVNCFYTAEAEQLLSAGSREFGIVLVHSPELAAAARDGGYALYLCGHTHGGQICLPGGIPLVTHLVRDRRLARGLWRLGGLVGYTNSGAGVAQPPVRFFSDSEVVLFTLRRGS